LDFKSLFRLEVTKDKGKIYGLCGWFDTFFEGSALGIDQISFSTSPFTTPTHWMQTVFLFETPLSVSRGDILSGTFSCNKSPKNPRQLVVLINWQCNGFSGSQSFGVV
jgi:hypothetical protein